MLTPIILKPAFSHKNTRKEREEEEELDVLALFDDKPNRLQYKLYIFSLHVWGLAVRGVSEITSCCLCFFFETFNTGLRSKEFL